MDRVEGKIDKITESISGISVNVGILANSVSRLDEDIRKLHPRVDALEEAQTKKAAGDEREQALTTRRNKILIGAVTAIVSAVSSAMTWLFSK